MDRSIRYKAVKQITESHCGPAVVQMQLNALGYQFDQEKITKKAGADKTIARFGTTPQELATAVGKLAPKTQFWLKEGAKVSDIKTSLQYGYPVGINWQGLFEAEGEEDKDWLAHGGYGHYSLVKGIDTDAKTLLTSEPHIGYKKFNRTIPLKTFVKRWYDYEMDRRSKKGIHKPHRYEHIMFIVTDAKETFPKEIGMKAI